MGFWKKLGKIAAIAAPIIAAPFTGGLSLAAIGAGAGAANAALSGGGWKRYLTDIGLGVGTAFGSKYLSQIGKAGHGINLANAPALGSTETGVVAGTTLPAAAGAASEAGALATSVPGSWASTFYGTGGVSAPSAVTGSELAATVPGSYASTLYNAGDFGVPGGTSTSAGVRGALNEVAKTAGKTVLNRVANRVGNAAADYWPLAASSAADLEAARIAADAAKHAADQQFEYGMKALEFEQGRYRDAQGNLQPWIAQGKNALGTIGNALMPSSGPAPTANNLAPQWISGLQANAQNNGMNMVTLKAPTGETRSVPSFQVPGYLAQGATRI